MPLAYHWSMKRVQTMVQLTDELLDELDKEAARRGCSRSAVVRTAIVEHLAAASEAARVRAYVEGYRRIPQGAVDEWGDLAAQLERENRAMSRRLDAEEDAAGLTW